LKQSTFGRADSRLTMAAASRVLKNALRKP
jgi:hypothetical protein